MKTKEIHIKEIHIKDINAGDTVLCEDGKIRTLCSKDITFCSFMGRQIWGDSYRSGTKPVKILILKRYGDEA